jgi:hypothetical protein
LERWWRLWCVLAAGSTRATPGSISDMLTMYEMRAQELATNEAGDEAMEQNCSDADAAD